MLRKKSFLVRFMLCSSPKNAEGQFGNVGRNSTKVTPNNLVPEETRNQQNHEVIPGKGGSSQGAALRLHKNQGQTDTGIGLISNGRFQDIAAAKDPSEMPDNSYGISFANICGSSDLASRNYPAGTDGIHFSWHGFLIGQSRIETIPELEGLYLNAPYPSWISISSVGTERLIM